MAVPGNTGKGRPRKRWRDALEDDLNKGRLDRGLATDRDRWRAQIMGKMSDLCEHGKRDVKWEDSLPILKLLMYDGIKSGLVNSIAYCGV